MSAQRCCSVAAEIFRGLIPSAIIFVSGCMQAVPVTTATVPLSRPNSPSTNAQIAAATSLTDPPLCPAPSNPDENAQQIGNGSSRSVLTYSQTPTLQNLYSRLVLNMQICTTQTLSPADRQAFTKILNFFGVNNAQSFAATIDVTGDAQGGIKFPQLVPFSYAYDQSKSTYATETIGQAEIPWQVTSSYDIIYSYKASKRLSVDTANLFRNITTTISGAGVATATLSPAASAYLAAADAVLQRVASTMFTDISSSGDAYHMDILQKNERAIIYRFSDLTNKPLAAVKLTVIYTNSLANPIPVDPLSGSVAPPQFSTLQDILSVPIGGTLVGTLGQNIAKEASYQQIIKATTTTSAPEFAASCDALEGALRTTYGLNIYDQALTMAQILAYNTPYLTSSKLYTSGCFRNRSVLKSMGITAFESPPATS